MPDNAKTVCYTFETQHNTFTKKTTKQIAILETQFKAKQKNPFKKMVEQTSISHYVNNCSRFYLRKVVWHLSHPM